MGKYTMIRNPSPADIGNSIRTQLTQSNYKQLESQKLTVNTPQKPKYYRIDENGNRVEVDESTLSRSNTVSPIRASQQINYQPSNTTLSRVVSGPLEKSPDQKAL